MKMYCYEIGVYPRLLWVAIGKKASIIKETFAFSDGSEIEDSFDANAVYAITTDVAHKKTGKYGVLVWFPDAESMSPNIITHESVHAAMEIFYMCHCFFTHDNQEPFAYLTSWIFDKIQETKRKMLKKS